MYTELSSNTTLYRSALSMTPSLLTELLALLLSYNYQLNIADLEDDALFQVSAILSEGFKDSFHFFERLRE